MEREIFLEHYRSSRNESGAAKQIARSGEAITYEAKGIKTGDSFALQLLPKATVDLDAREQFEEQARAIQALSHPHVAKLIAFGIEDDHFVFVSEYLPGETVESWVTAHGPMPPDATVRVALQVTSALIAAANLGLMHRAIQPANLVIVPGETAEGGWPFVKLTDFRPAAMPSEAGAFASPEQLQNGTVDFRSEIYSLGATMCFLLSGIAASNTARLQQLSQFPKPLRRLLSEMLRPDPNQRPQDSALFADALRNTLRKVERRQAFSRQFGIPPAIAPVSGAPARSLLPRVLALAALLLASAAIASVLLPEGTMRHVWHWNRAPKEIGVPIGLPETSPAPSPELAANATIAPAPEVRSTSTPVVVAQEKNAEPEPPTEGPDTEGTSASTDADANAEPSATPEVTAKTQRQAAANERKPSMPATRPRAPQSRPNESSPRSTARSGSFPARYLGTTPDGMLIFGLPNGEIKILRPRSHRFRHYPIERRARPYEPPFQPYD